MVVCNMVVDINAYQGCEVQWLVLTSCLSYWRRLICAAVCECCIISFPAFLQEHIDALYSYVEKLQESKADKENVALEMNIKADKAALDSKVNVSTFDNTFNMLDEGLREALQKMDDYMNEEMALKQALKQLSTDMSEKMDGQAFQALKNYLGTSRVRVYIDVIGVTLLQTTTATVKSNRRIFADIITFLFVHASPSSNYNRHDCFLRLTYPSYKSSSPPPLPPFPNSHITVFFFRWT